MNTLNLHRTLGVVRALREETATELDGPALVLVRRTVDYLHRAMNAVLPDALRSEHQNLFVAAGLSSDQPMLRLELAQLDGWLESTIGDLKAEVLQAPSPADQHGEDHLEIRLPTPAGYL